MLDSLKVKNLKHTTTTLDYKTGITTITNEFKDGTKETIVVNINKKLKPYTNPTQE